MGKFYIFKTDLCTDENGLSFGGVVDTLLAMAKYRLMPETKTIHFIPYPADTLYILTVNQDTIVSRLIDLGKKWQADSVDICDGTREEYGWRLKRCLLAKLEGSLGGENIRQRDTVTISYWWD